MELALHFGMPYELLTCTMSERELRKWQRYAREQPLPFERLQLYLAQVCQVIMASVSTKPVSLKDYVMEFHPAEEDEDGDEVSVEEQRKAFGFNPRNK